MPFNKISGQSNNPPMLPIALSGGEAFMLPVGQGVVGTFGSVLNPQLGTNNPVTGQFLLELGQYTNLQMFDDALNYWRNAQVTPYAQVTVSSDGKNYRVVNSTGCPVGALITTATLGVADGFYGYNQQGAQITIQNGVMSTGNSVFTITPVTGTSKWNAIVGGAVSATISLTGTGYANLPNWYVTGSPSFTINAGSNYTKPPIIVFAPPSNQGQQPYVLPTAVCTISGGAINAITVTNIGAGLLGLPQISIVNQPTDTTGGGAVLGWIAANAVEQGTGTLLEMWPNDYGVGITAVETFTFSPSGPAATAIMNFTITGVTQSTAGVAYVGAGAFFSGGIVAGTASASPMYDKALSIPIFPTGYTVAATTGAVTLVSGAFRGVNIQAVPQLTSVSSGAAPSTAAVNVVAVGPANDVVKFQSF